MFIILNQFEEYFLYHHPAEPKEGTFAFEFPHAVTRSRLRVNFLLSLRKNSLAELDFFKGRLLNSLTNRMELGHLDWNSAKEAIKLPIYEYYNKEVSPEETFDIEDEEELVEQILKEVSQNNNRNHSGRIEAPYLQLVMERLWEKEKENGSRCLRLETFRKLGGATGIAKQHLNQKMEKLSENKRDIEIAASIFHYLVTPSGGKMAYCAFDLAELANQARRDRDQSKLVTEDELKLWLDKLTQRDFRLLRPVGKSPNLSYEIFHDVLAQPILDWLAKYWKRKQQERGELEAKLIEEKATQKANQKLQKANKEAGKRILIGMLVAILLVVVGIFIARKKQEVISVQNETVQTRVDFWDYTQLRVNINYMNIDTLLKIMLAVDSLQKVQNDWWRRWFISRADNQEQIEKLKNILKSALNASIQEQNQLELQILSQKVPLKNVDFSAGKGKERFAVVLKDDGTIHLGDFQDKQLGEQIAVKNPVSLSLNPNGNKLATVSEDGTIDLWDTKGKNVGNLPSNKPSVLSISFIDDGKKLAIVAEDGSIRLWDIQGKFRQENDISPVDTKGLTSLTFSPDGTRIATASEDGTIRLRKLQEQSSQAKVIHQGDRNNENRLTSLSFTPDGTQLAAVSENGLINLWGTKDEASRDEPLVGFLMNLPNDKSKKIKILSASFVSDGLQFAIASEDGTIYLWNFRNKRLNLDKDNLNDLLKKGCEQLSDYLKTHPENREDLPCPASETEAKK